MSSTREKTKQNLTELSLHSGVVKCTKKTCCHIYCCRENVFICELAAAGIHSLSQTVRYYMSGATFISQVAAVLFS